MRKRHVVSLLALLFIVVIGIAIPKFTIDHDFATEKDRQCARLAVQETVSKLESLWVFGHNITNVEGSKRTVQLYTVFGIPYAVIEIQRCEQVGDISSPEGTVIYR